MTEKMRHNNTTSSFLTYFFFIQVGVNTTNKSIKQTTCTFLTKFVKYFNMKFVGRQKMLLQFFFFAQ